MTLEGPFRGLGEAEANLAYAQSLSAVNHILRMSGEAGCTRVDATGNEVETTRVVAMGARSRVEFEGAVVLAVVRIGGNP